MNLKLSKSLKQILIIPVTSSIALLLFSFIVGWNILTLLLFWFLVIPFLAYTLPGRITKNERHLKQSIIGLIIFYAIMVFLIYEHYQTDYFIVMMISLISNIGIVSLVSWGRKPILQDAVHS